MTRGTGLSQAGKQYKYFDTGSFSTLLQYLSPKFSAWRDLSERCSACKLGKTQDFMLGFLFPPSKMNRVNGGGGGWGVEDPLLSLEKHSYQSLVFF